MNFETVSCSLNTIKAALPHDIWLAAVSDRTVSPVVSRLFHNKIVFWGNDLARCYLTYFSPEYIARLLTIIGLMFFIIGAGWLVSKHQFWPLILLLVLPLGTIFLQIVWLEVATGLLEAGIAGAGLYAAGTKLRRSINR